MTKKVEKLDLKQSLRTAAGWLAGAYSLIFVVVVSAAVYSSRTHHSLLANTMARSVRNDLLIRDFRQVISTLSSSLRLGFNAIEFIPKTGEASFALPSLMDLKGEQAYPLGESISIPIYVAADFEPQGEAIGILKFYYRLSTPLMLSFGVWIAFLALAFPVFRKMRLLIERRHNAVLQSREAALLTAIAQQVSHDIRSPLSALNLAVKKIGTVAPDEMLVIKSAAMRINDIANDLLHRQKPAQSTSNRFLSVDDGTAIAPLEASLQRVVIADLLKTVFTEKQTLFQERDGIQLKLDIRDEFSVKCDLDPKEFCRVISNLTNNSAEALGPNGVITIAMRPTLKSVSVVISDNGKGIPETLLARLGKERVSFGKFGSESGTGLGVLHARIAVESMGGKFSIQSRVDLGTLVTMTFPRAP